MDDNTDEACLYPKMFGNVHITGSEVTQPAFSLHHALWIVIGVSHGYAPPTGLCARAPRGSLGNAVVVPDLIGA